MTRIHSRIRVGLPPRASQRGIALGRGGCGAAELSLQLQVDRPDVARVIGLRVIEHRHPHAGIAADRGIRMFGIEAPRHLKGPLAGAPAGCSLIAKLSPSFPACANRLSRRPDTAHGTVGVAVLFRQQGEQHVHKREEVSRSVWHHRTSFCRLCRQLRSTIGGSLLDLLDADLYKETIADGRGPHNTRTNRHA